MKTNTLLLIASLAVLATNASAASSQTESDLVVLPTYVVTAPRQQVIEQRIDASLNEFRRQANTPLLKVTELCTFTVPAPAVTTSPDNKEHSSPVKRGIRVATL